MVTHSVHSTLNSIGGIQVLFPLFAQLDLPSSESQTSSNEITTTASTNDKSSTATAVSTKDQSLWYVYSIYTYLLHNGATGQKKNLVKSDEWISRDFFLYNFNIFWNWPSINDITHLRGRRDLSIGDDTPPQVYLVKWVTRGRAQWVEIVVVCQ